MHALKVRSAPIRTLSRILCSRSMEGSSSLCLCSRSTYVHLVPDLHQVCHA